MNLLAESPLWLLAILSALILAAAAEDAVRLRISNVTCAAVLAGAIVAMALQGFSISLWQNAAVFAALLAAGTLLFASGKMGGGDVKLFAALGLWCDFLGALTLMAAVFIAGGVLAILILGARTFAPAAPASRIAVLRPRAGIPYGIAIAAGSLFAITVA